MSQSPRNSEQPDGEPRSLHSAPAIIRENMLWQLWNMESGELDTLIVAVGATRDVASRVAHKHRVAELVAWADRAGGLGLQDLYYATQRVARGQGLHQRYLNRLIQEFDKPDIDPLLSISTSSELHPSVLPVTLSDIFVAPFIKNCFHPSDIDPITFLRNSHTFPAMEPQDASKRRISVIDAVKALPRLALKGDPGGGKTSTIRYIMVQLAELLRDGSSMNTSPPPDFYLLPVPIALNSFYKWLRDHKTSAQYKEHSPTRLVFDYLTHWLGDFLNTEETDKILERIRDGDAILFFDGLDEVPHSQDAHAVGWRNEVSQCIREFASNMPASSHIVVTCRSYVYRSTDPWVRILSMFRTIEIDKLDYDEGQPDEIILKWCIFAKEHNLLKASVSETLEVLKQHIQTHKYLMDMADQPLLLTLIMLVYLQNGSLPADRADLYDRAVNLLLAAWENHKSRPPDMASVHRAHRIIALDVLTDDIRSVLANLAYSLFQQRLAYGHEQTLDNIRVKKELRDCLHLEEAKIDDFIDYISKRAGMLVPEEDATYHFPHRSFQEYMAAAYIVKQDNAADLLITGALKAFDDWRQVLSLALQIMERSHPHSLIYVTNCLLDEWERFTLETPRQTVANAAMALALAGNATMAWGSNQGLSHIQFTKNRFREQLERIAFQYEGMPAATRCLAANGMSSLGDTRESVLQAGAMEFQFIPRGPFYMGRKAEDPTLPGDEINSEVMHSLDYDYWIGKFPVTEAHYHDYLHASGRASRTVGAIGKTSKPVSRITWREACKFCRWLNAELIRSLEGTEVDANLLEGLKEGRLKVSLPSEAEWEKAARGERDDRLYPWGDAADPERANYSAKATVDGAGDIGTTSVVGCFPAGRSLYGLEECCGNVWEWTRSLSGVAHQEWTYLYPYRNEDGRENLIAEKDRMRIARGGSFASSELSIRVVCRQPFLPTLPLAELGFRVAVVPASLLVGTRAKRIPLVQSE